jgi:hypothetical protein
MFSLLPTRRADLAPEERVALAAADGPAAPVRQVPVAVAELRPLVARLAELHPRDAAATDALHLDARAVLARLTAVGALPRRFRLGGLAGPSVLSATLVGAWEHATRSPAVRHLRG